MTSAAEALKLLSTQPKLSQADLQDQRRRMNQQPAISEAKETALAGVALPPIGAIVEYAGSSAPADGKWVFCQGQLLSRDSYPDLFAVIGTWWNTGGELSTEFRVPDRRGRVGIGAGQGSGLTNRGLAARLGVEQYALTLTEMPVHAHGSYTGSVTFSHSHGGAVGSVSLEHAHAYNRVGSLNSISGLAGGGGYSAATGVNLGTYATTDNLGLHNHGIGLIEQTHNHSIGETGAGDYHENMQPSIAMNYIIRALP